MVTSRKFLVGSALLLLFVAFLAPLAVYAISIDDFSGSQTVSEDTTGESSFGGVLIDTSLKGARGLRVSKSGGSALLRVETQILGGVVNHSHDANVTGSSLIIWDGDNAPGVNFSGLGGIDFTQDGGNAIKLDLIYVDVGTGSPVSLMFTVYDQSDISGQKWSAAIYSIPSDITTTQTIEIPFSNFLITGPNGAADFTKVGAVTLSINGNSSPAADLTFDSIYTNGQCRLFPDSNNKVIDICNVCGGDGTSCLDCAGVPFGSAVLDQCNVCNGDGTSCLDCAGTPFGAAQLDQCNVCNGDGTSCLDCAGTPFGSAKLDRCGVCNGDGQSCVVCREGDSVEILADMDQGAKFQERITRQAVRELKKRTKNRKTLAWVDELSRKTHDLQLKNWVLSWQFPLTSKVCDPNPFCVSTSTQPKIEEYNARSEELRQTTYAVVNAMRKIRGVSRTIGAGLLRRADRQHAVNLSVSKLVPTSHSVCF